MAGAERLNAPTVDLKDYGFQEKKKGFFGKLKENQQKALVQIQERQEFKDATKLHELLAIALKDLEKVERDPNQKIDLNVWVKQEPDSQTTRVCLAGAILYNRFGVTGDVSTAVGYLSNKNKMDALFALAMGVPYQAYFTLKGSREITNQEHYAATVQANPALRMKYFPSPNYYPQWVEGLKTMHKDLEMADI